MNNSGYFFINHENKNNQIALPAEYIYDQTYKSYKIKQKFEKDRKFSYFNAVMQMKRKLSAKQEVYKNVFESDQQNQINEMNHNQTQKSFYRNPQHTFCDQIRIKKLNNNSFKISKEHSADTLYQNSKQTNQFNRTGMSYGRKSQTSDTSHVSFEMINKPRNNRSYVQLSVNQTSMMSSMQPFNPKPRLDEIMAEYRRINRHAINQNKNRKSTLPREVIDKIYMTNKMMNYPKSKSRNI